MKERVGDWVQTYSGRQWWPHDPRPEDVRHEDFPAIAQVIRFGGHCRGLYTVAQHSCLVYDFIRKNRRCSGDPEIVERLERTTVQLCASALIHDLHKIYPPGDQLAPFVRTESGLPPEVQAGIAWLRWTSREAAFVVRKALGVPLELPELVKYADLVLLATERRDILVTPEHLLPFWANLPEPWSQRIDVWSAERAWVEWRERFKQLFGYVPDGGQ